MICRSFWSMVFLMKFVRLDGTALRCPGWD
jgi:hypothetical protein